MVIQGHLAYHLEMQPRSQVAIAVAALALFTAGVLACGSFSGTDQPNGSDASSDPGPLDAASVADSAPVPDAAGPFCSLVDASFCWSFDEGSDFLHGLFLQPSANTPPILTDAARSAPYAMQVSPDAGSTSTLDIAAVAEHGARCDFDMAVDTPGPNGTNAFFVVAADYSNYAIVLENNAGTVSAHTEIGTSQRMRISNIALGEWTHIALAISVTADAGRHADGIVGKQHAALEEALGDASSSVGKLTAALGITFGNGGGWAIRYDNFVCQWN